MKIVILSETFCPNMGYLETCLPKYMARSGVDVHLVALNLRPYHQLKSVADSYSRLYAESQKSALGEGFVVNGHMAHLLPHKMLFGYPYMQGLGQLLAQLQPDIVYSVNAIGWLALQAAICQPRFGYRLFTGSHTAASTFPLAKQMKPYLTGRGLKSFLSRWLPGRAVSFVTEKCYVPTPDCGEVASRFFGVQPRKVSLVYLGVDSDYFYPVVSESDQAERLKTRDELGVSGDEILCIYTGKLEPFKNPALLAKAVSALQDRGKKYRSLFIGEGTEKPVLRSISGNLVLDAVDYSELGRYYRAADIAVWLTNESTSMLDAAGCGVPLIVSDQIYQDHVVGNGLSYRMNNLDSLVDCLLQLADPVVRQACSRVGVEKIRRSFNWDFIAKERIRDFSLAVER